MKNGVDTANIGGRHGENELRIAEIDRVVGVDVAYIGVRSKEKETQKEKEER